MLQSGLATAEQPGVLIDLAEICKCFDNIEVIRDISLSVHQGELVSVLGPSGCGKSTLMNIITGLINADRGQVWCGGEIGYMQQKDLLLPWKTIIDNVILSRELRGENRKTLRKEAMSYFETFGLEGYEYKYPYELSGGMKQRASFFRTFFSSREIMLLDEPFGALDSITRGKMQRWLLEMKNRMNITILFITHDIDEAVLLSDRVYMLSEKPSIVKKEFELDFYCHDKEQRLLSPAFIDVKKEIIAYL
jgi:ABC-type nitrate/sulfonate/bicarbonate transport system ATPase subunit